MQSSYNLIKSSSALKAEKKVIATSYERKKYDAEEILNDDALYEERRRIIENYESIGAEIIKDAQSKREKILLESRTQGALIEKNAYEKGYNQGLQNGQEDAKKEAAETIIPKAQKEAQNIISNAENILKSAKNDYADYLDGKKEEIVDLALSIAKKILNKEIIKDDGINEIIEDAFELSKGAENIIIKCNSTYEENLKKQIEKWKTTYNISGEIFIMTDESMELGNAIIEKKNGIVKVGIDIGLSAIEKAILE